MSEEEAQTLHRILDNHGWAGVCEEIAKWLRVVDESVEAEHVARKFEELSK